jgi:hypothetical protein
MKKSYAEEPNEAHKNILKEEILQVINEKFRDDTGYGQPKCTGDTQEIPRLLNREFEKVEEQIKKNYKSTV